MSASLASECNDVKEYVSSHFMLAVCQGSDAEYRRYDSCFLKWYSESKHCAKKSKHVTVQLTREAEFLRGDSTTDECEPLFKQYKTCLTVLRSPPHLILLIFSLRFTESTERKRYRFNVG